VARYQHPPKFPKYLVYNLTDLNLKEFGVKKCFAAFNRILCADQSPILAKKEVFLKNSNQIFSSKIILIHPIYTKVPFLSISM
jgi:hypothetical protein